MITDLKDLQKLLKLCRSQGITDIKLNGIEIKFGDLPSDQKTLQDDVIPTVNPYANFPDGELSPEQLAFYSSGGMPENDPENKEAI